MAHSCLRFFRPWTTSVRFLLTSVSKRKEVNAQVAVIKDRDKQDVRHPSSAAGEDYFSGLIHNLQGSTYENTPKSATVDEKVEHSVPEDGAPPRMTQAVLKPSLRTLTQKQLHLAGINDANLGSQEKLQTEENGQLHSLNTPASEQQAKILMPVINNVENLRMTAAGLAEELPPTRTTLATLPPPVLSFSRILCSQQVATDLEKGVSFEDTLTSLQAEAGISSITNSEVASDVNVTLPQDSENVVFSKRAHENAENQSMLDYQQSIASSIPKTNTANDVVREIGGLTPEDQAQQVSATSRHSPGISIDDIAPAITPSFTLAAFVHRSESLQKLVKLGVDVSIWETKKDVPEYVLRLDFDRDMKGHIQFLHDLGVPADGLGRVLTKNPFLFKHSLENLQVRLNYLESKRFTKDAVATIIVKSPHFLNLSTKAVDERLGYLQKLFTLTGDEVRNVITRQPKLVSWGFDKIQQMQFTMLEEFGFSSTELKMIFMAKPKLWLASRPAVQERFDFLHTTVGISHKLITKFPGALLCRKFITQQRHLYLKHLGRDQYDPTKANYVSLKALVTGTDSDFCRHVTKTPVQQFNDFLKTL